jgi:hypothetical protein
MATCDLRGVPARAVLVCEQHQLAAFEPGVTACIVEQHEREQAVHLRLVRHQLGERVSEPERLRGEIEATAVALVEDQVDDRQHRSEPLGQQVVVRHGEGDAGVPDLALRAREAALHGLFGNEEGAGDLLGAQTTERTEGQSDLGLEGERRVAAGEDQLQALVGKGRLLRGLLGEVEVAERTDQGSEHAPPLVAEDLLEQRPSAPRPGEPRSLHPFGRRGYARPS